MPAVTQKRVSTAVKALNNTGRIGGYLVVYGDSAHKDLQNEYFTPATDLGLNWYPRRPVLYHHGLDQRLETKMIGQIEVMQPDETGVWVEAQLDMRDRWAQAVMSLVERNSLGWSSGSLPHMVRTERDGKITRWPIVEGSLTPSPAEPRHTEVISRKHLSDAVAVTEAFKSVGLGTDLLVPDDASEGAAVREQAAEGTSGDETHAREQEVSNRPISSPMEVKKMTIVDLTPESIQKMVEDGVEKALKAQKDQEEQDALKAKAARVDALEAENAALKAQQPPTDPIKRLPGHVEEADEEAADPEAAKTRMPIIHVAGKYDSLSAEDMAWGHSYMKALERARAMAGNPVTVVSEKYNRAMAEKVYAKGYRFEDQAGKAMKADELIHTTNTGFGAEWIPDVWSGEVWRKARSENVIFNLINFIDMPTGTVNVRIEGADPTVYYVPETEDETQLTLDGAGNPIPDSKVASGKVTLTAKKLALRVGISMEETEDAMIPVLPLYREQAMRVMTDSIDNVILNGDTEPGATGNINSDDGAPSATSKYLVFNGLRKLGLVTNTANKLDFNGGPTRSLFNDVRWMMPMRYSLRPSGLAYVVDGNTYGKMLLMPEFSTVDKYAQNATVLTGELGRIDNIPILPSAEYGLTEADGKLSATPANNTKGQVTCVYFRGWLGGFVRRVAATLAYLPYYDSYQMVATVRLALINFDTEVAATGYNITV